LVVDKSGREWTGLVPVWVFAEDEDLWKTQFFKDKPIGKTPRQVIAHARRLLDFA
jgi:hypothetical protein